MPLAAGDHLGPYRILGPLGSGGMGEVYRAHDPRLGRDVALKILPQLFAQDADRVARFQREAQVLASLNHPNVGGIHGVEDAPSTSSGQAPVRALVLELVEGPTLADRIAQGPLPLDDALTIARQIVDALDAAHEHGIIHRDLKPANIKLRPDGTVKVLDFGLAKAMSGDTSAASVSMSPTITSPAMTAGGVILGTAAYMSPEQARGKAVDKRTDIWAFGCVLYEMLTGKRAFDSDEITDVLAFIITKEPAWKGLPEATPAAIRKLLRRCLEKDRKKRLADISDARLEMDDAPDESAVLGATSAARLAATSRSIWKRAMPPITAAVVAGVIAGTAIWKFRAPDRPKVLRFSYTLPEGQQFTNVARQQIAISPDAQQLVYVANRQLYLRIMSELEGRPIPGSGSPQGISGPSFSPDGGSVVFFANGEQAIKRIAVGGGESVAVVSPVELPSGIHWSGEAIVFAQSRGIMRVSPSGGKPELIVSLKTDEAVCCPQLLPGGQALLYSLAKGTGAHRWDTGQVVVQSLQSGERKLLVEGGSDGRYLPTGHITYSLGGVVLAVPFDLARFEVRGGPVPVLEGVRRVLSGAAAATQFAVSGTGTLAYIPGPRTASSFFQLALIDRKGGTEILKLPAASYQFPRISPDGKHIAFGTDDGKEAIVWIYELSGASSVRRLTFGGNNRFPIWSSASEWVAFQSDRDGDLGIFRQRADGTGKADRLTKPEQGTSHVPESWSPDGARFLFSVTKGMNVTLHTFTLHDRKTEAYGDVHSSILTTAVFSPDGRWVAYQAGARGNNAIYVQPFPSTGAKYEISKGSAHHPLWSPDGKDLIYVPARAQPVVVKVTTQPNFTLTDPIPAPTTWNEIGASTPRTYDITPDGGKYVGIVAAGDSSSGVPAAPRIHVVVNWFEDLKQRVPAPN